MVKADIVKQMMMEFDRQQVRLKEPEVLMVVDRLLESLKHVIVRDGRLEIRDFGVFQVKQRRARTGRNPKNKRSYPIPPRKVVTFKSGKEIKDLGQTPQG